MTSRRAPRWRSPMWRAGGGADAAQGRKQGGLLRLVLQQARRAQVLPGAGVARWLGCVPELLRHRRGGAALCIARPPEGRAAAERAVPVVPQLSEEESKGKVPPMPPGAFVKDERAIRHCRQGGGRGPVRALCSLHKFTWTLRRLAFRGSKGAVCFGGE